MAKSPARPFWWSPGDELLFVGATSLIKRWVLDGKKQFWMGKSNLNSTKFWWKRLLEMYYVYM